DNPDEAIAELGGERDIRIEVEAPATAEPRRFEGGTLELPHYERGGDSVATRKAYGDALLALGRGRPDVVALDGEVSDSTFADEFAKELPERFFAFVLADQTLVS